VAALFLVVGLRLQPRRGSVLRVTIITYMYVALVGLIDAMINANYMFFAALLISGRSCDSWALPVVPRNWRHHRSPVLLAPLQPVLAGPSSKRLRRPPNQRVTSQSMMTQSPEPSSVRSPRLHKWNDRVVLGAVIASFASGFGQFGS